MLAPRPVVEDLWTRKLETNDLERGRVQSAGLVHATATRVVLKTEAFPRMFAGSDLITGRSASEPVGGTAQFDLVAPGVIRFRYTEAEAADSEDRTPMLVGPLDSGAGAGPQEPEIAAGEITWDIGDGHVGIGLFPFGYRVLDAARRTVCEVGGDEKNVISRWDSFNCGVHWVSDHPRVRDDPLPIATECFTLHPQEAIYGFGEKFAGLDKRGQTLDLVMMESTGVITPRSYKNVPFFCSTMGYGVLFNTSARMTAWVGSMSAADVQIAIEDDRLDYFVIVGDGRRLESVLDRYTDLTGKPGLPPRWSFGWWQSKISYASADETLEVARGLRDAGVPVDVVHVDTNWFRTDWQCDLEFDPDRFPDPPGWLAQLDEMGVKVSLWQLPYIPEGSALFDDLLRAGGFVRNEAGEMYDLGICYAPGFDGRVGCIDFTNPAGVEVYQRHLRRLLEMGVRAIKVDFGEEAPLDGVYHDGTPGRLAHNLYPLLYNKAVAEITEKVHGEKIIWARSAWAGSQRYPLHWGGDSSANWENLIPQIAGGLSFGMSGFCFWSQDIGGFFGTASDDLLVRWVQAGVLLSHARIHGVGDREIDKRDPETLAVCRDFVRLRYRLLPYLWAQAADSAARSLPMTRPLVLSHQDDPTTWNIADEWTLGDDLLVAPIFNPDGRRNVYIPAGTWYDWWTREPQPGRRWIDIDTPLDRIPLWVREGAVIPLGPEMLHVDANPIDRLTLRVAPISSNAERHVTHATACVGNDQYIPITYRVADGIHQVSVDAPGIEIDIDMLGGSHAPQVTRA